jgi:hypothetical protein
MLSGVAFANRGSRFVFGLPFLLVWIIAWVVATSVCMALLYAIDQRRQPASDPSETESP